MEVSFFNGNSHTHSISTNHTSYITYFTFCNLCAYIRGYRFIKNLVSRLERLFHDSYIYSEGLPLMNLKTTDDCRVITFNSPAIRDSYNNYLSHQFEVSISDFITGEGTIECINCGCEHKGDPREFEWLIYPPCEKE